MDENTKQKVIEIVRAYLIIPVWWFMWLEGWFDKIQSALGVG